MEKLYYCESIAKIDEISQKEFNQPGIILMEQAGLKAWQYMKNKIKHSDKILIVAGGGNNGGDALVIARCAINDGFNNIKILYCSNKFSESTLIQKKILEKYNVESIFIDDDSSLVFREINDASIIVDGIFAIGLKSKIRVNSEKLINNINESNAIVYSVDVPSGISDVVNEVSINANYTFCMGPLKLLYYFHKNILKCGQIIEINPSFPPFAISKVEESAYIEESLNHNIKALAMTDYKKSRGHLAVFGGSTQYSGALRLTSKAAFTSRCGLVSVFCDKDIYNIVATESPSIIVNIIKDNFDLNPYDAILVGPGWSNNREHLLKKLLFFNKPMVIDADGIRAFANLYKKERINMDNKQIIFTPHLGELKALADAVLVDYSLNNTVDFIKSLKDLSSKLNSVIVCKASVTYIVSPNNKPIIIKNLNPSLAVAGSGDVLAGCISSLLANTKDLYNSAIEGVKIHSKAGLLANKDVGFYTSEELMKYIGIQLS
ncbi:MAG: NAD(P)H-hydrate dehydratase [Pleomorphochaeta sp.]